MQFPAALGHRQGPGMQRTPVPILKPLAVTAVADFENGTYSIGNQTGLAISDLFVKDTRYLGNDWDAATDIVPGVGFVNNTTPQRGAVATPALKAAVLQQQGFSAVIEYTFTGNGGCYLEWCNLGTYPYNNLFYGDGSTGSFLDDSIFLLPGYVSPSLAPRKVGLTFAPVALIYEQRGEEQVLVIGNDISLLKEIAFSGFRGCTMRKITFYTMTDKAGLISLVT